MIPVPFIVQIGTARDGVVLHQVILEVPLPAAPARSLSDATTEELLEELRRRVMPGADQEPDDAGEAPEP